MDKPYIDMPDELYFDGSHFGVHAMMDFDKYGPLEFYNRHIIHSVANKSNHAYDMGTATHELVLRGDLAFRMRVSQRPQTYTDEKKVSKKWNGNAKKCKEWKAKNDDKLILSKEDVDTVKTMRHSVFNHPEAARLLKQGDPEVGMRVYIEGVPAQIKCDWYLEGEHNADLKSCMTIEEFHKSFYDYGYWRQAAHYTRVTKLVTGKQIPFYFIAVEKSSPHRCEVFQIDDDYLMQGDVANMKTLRAIGHCMSKYGTEKPWPMFSDKSKYGLQTINKPAFL